MIKSILNSTKKLLNIHPDDTSFDEELLMHINSVFATLNQLGVGPDDGFYIDDADVEWDTYPVSKHILNQVKIYMGLCIRLIFDPPESSFAMDALKEQRDEKGWRLQVQAEDERATA